MNRVPLIAGPTLVACPVCMGSIRDWRTKVNEHGEFKVTRCVECGFAFVNPRPTLEYLRSFYREHGHGERDVSSLEDILARERGFPNSSIDAGRMVETIGRLLGPNRSNTPRRFLDVGCGYGFFSREALDRGFEVCALEVASVERSISERMTGLKPLPTSFEDFSAPEGSFDAILMSQVLEHAPDVDAWAGKVHLLLAPGGVLAVALPNFSSIFRFVLQEKEPYIIPPAHLNYFSRKSLVTLLARRGFKVAGTQWVSRIDPNVVFRRVPVTRFLGRGIRLPLRMSLALLDIFRLGMMINVYARR